MAFDEMAAGEIAAHFAVTRPAISQHLTVLKEAGLIVERRDGTRRLYRIRPEGMAELRAFLADMWPDALERFKVQAESSLDTTDLTGGNESSATSTVRRRKRRP